MDNNKTDFINIFKSIKKQTLDQFSNLFLLKTLLFNEFNIFNSIKIILNLKNCLNEFLFFQHYSIFFFNDKKLIKINSIKCSYKEKNDVKIKEEINNIFNALDEFKLYKLDESYTSLYKLFDNHKNSYFLFSNNFFYSEIKDKVLIVFHLKDELNIKINFLKNYFKIFLKIVEFNFYNKLDINIYKISIFLLIYNDVLRIITENLDILIILQFYLKLKLDFNSKIKIIDSLNDFNKNEFLLLYNRNIINLLNLENNNFTNLQLIQENNDILQIINNNLKLLDFFIYYDNNLKVKVYYYNFNNILVYNNIIVENWFKFGNPKNINFKNFNKNNSFSIKEFNFEEITLKQNCKNKYFYTKLIKMVNDLKKKNEIFFETNNKIQIQINYDINKNFLGYFLFFGKNEINPDDNFNKNLKFCLKPIKSQINEISSISYFDIDNDLHLSSNEMDIKNTILLEYIPNDQKDKLVDPFNLLKIVKKLSHKLDKMEKNLKENVQIEENKLKNFSWFIKRKPKDKYFKFEENYISKNELVNWNFDILELDEIKLCRVLYEIFDFNDFFNIYKIPENLFFNFIWKCNYFYSKNNNYYHNFKHCVAVAHGANFLLKFNKFKKFLKGLEFPIIISAIGHDLDHYGYTNSYLNNSKSDLSILYHENSTLEQHHIYILFKILNFEENNILKFLDEETYKKFKKIIINCILGTDMQNHFKQLASIKNKILDNKLNESKEEDINDISSLLIHVSDLQGPSKKLEISIKWSKLVNLEFSDQYEQEILNKYTVTPYFKDLEIKNIYHKNEFNFMKFIIKPLYEIVYIFLEEEEEIEKIYMEVKNNLKFHFDNT